MSGSDRLAPDAARVLRAGEVPVWFSVASVWEMAIKKSLGRLDYPDNLEKVLDTDHIGVLPVQLPHAQGVSALPMHHRDPFDRMIVSQAISEGLTLLTHDTVFEQYNVDLMLA